MSIKIYFFTVFICYFLNSIKGQHIFDNNPDDRCITPHRKPGKCIPLERCPTLLKALSSKAAMDPKIKQYLRRSLCRNDDKSPIVCCEIDAGACTTPEEQIGACVPLNRCAPVINFLTMDPFFTENKVNYIRASQCSYDGTEGDKNIPRVCCPMFTSNITGQVNSRFEQTTTTTPTPNKQTPSTNPTTISNFIGSTSTTKKPVTKLVDLPTPGEKVNQCGSELVHERIIGGNVTDLFDHPWMALLQYGDGEFACGGSLIHPKYVLTAAHCVTGAMVEKHKNLASVRLGEWDIESEDDCVTRQEGYDDCSDKPIDFEPEEVIYHSEFSIQKLQNDIALIRLKGEAPWTDSIRPICLPTQHIDLIGRNFSIAGWGRTETESSSSVKLFLDNQPLFPKDACSKAYEKSRITLLDSQFCAGGLEGMDSCQGDSGGPIMVTQRIRGMGSLKYQVGLVSFGSFICGLEGKPAVYTYVEHYMDWIYENMRP